MTKIKRIDNVLQGTGVEHDAPALESDAKRHQVKCIRDPEYAKEYHKITAIAKAYCNIVEEE